MFCNIDGIDIYYETHGEGKPIIFVHGFGVDHRKMMGPIEPVFQGRKGWKRIYFDLPGMGRTKGDLKIKDADTLLELVMKFIEAVIPGQSFLLGGESYGSFLCRGIVYKNAKMIDGHLMICPAIFFDKNKRSIPKRTILKRDGALLSRLSDKEREEFDYMSVIEDDRTWNEFKKDVLPGLLIADEKFLAWFYRRGCDFSFSSEKLPVPYEKPTLIITGRQDHIVGYRDAFGLIEDYPRATFAILDKAGHNLQVEQCGLMQQLICEWLDRVEESIKERESL